MTADEAPSLDDLAKEFADKLTALTRGVLGQDSPRFHALNMGNKVRVSPIRDDEVVRRIPVRIGGEPLLSLFVRHDCCWDGSSTFLAADKADIKLFYDRVADPLLRFEYVRDSREPPGAHIQVHAHRDEMAYLLRLSEKAKSRPRKALRSRKLPKLAEMHIPVGGHRMRPALEDVLLFLEREFGIDVEPDWRAVIDKHLREWRAVQLKAAVRDEPEAAVEVLRNLGYLVEAPKAPHPRPAPEAIKLYWP